MIDKRLNPEQIDNLCEFCEFHNVYYYDVQIELVDHLASSVEKLWETNPELPFEEAVFLVGEQFGGKAGFVSIREAKGKELQKKYTRLQWKYIEEFFQLPKIILTLAITFTLYYVFKYSNNYLKVSYIIQLIYFIFFFILLSVFYPKKLRLNIISGKEFLLYDHFKNIRRRAISIGFSSLNILSYLFRAIRFKFDSPISIYLNAELLTAFLITLYGILIFGICVYSPQRIKEDFIREFPQFVKS
ncbi:MAG TPA: hypothetical protein VF373_11395 [Prolixibacteraceae bacterium]